MAYEMKEGDFQFTTGDKATSLKIHIGDRDLECVIFPKTFNWGKVKSGNIKGLTLIYVEFIRFTVRAVAHFWREEMKKQNEQAPVLKTQETKPEERTSLLR